MAMTVMTYSLAQFVNDLRAVTGGTDDVREIVGRVRPLVQQLALGKNWLEPRHYICDTKQGFGAHLLHEQSDHSLAVLVGAWLPGRGAPPHNHGTWAVVAGVEGAEKNIFWKRLDDGSRPGHAEIRAQGEKVFGPGDVLVMLPDSIHSVVNETDRVTVSLHVYGKHPNYTGRAQFDPTRNLELPFVFKQE
jgi:predicted metal-dependent enzyme (double-stranded beta helix superfamily)